MEEEKQEELKSEPMRVSGEFIEWVRKIQEEWQKKRGWKPSDAQITINIKRQFTGQFIV